MYELKKNGKVFTSKVVGTGPSSYKKIIYRAAVSQRLRSTGLQTKGYKEGQALFGTFRKVRFLFAPCNKCISSHYITVLPPSSSFALVSF